MDVEKIEDHLVAAPLLFAREDRNPGRYTVEREDKETLFQGEGEDDPDEEGLSRSPSDVWMPEKEK